MGKTTRGAAQRAASPMYQAVKAGIATHLGSAGDQPTQKSTIQAVKSGIATHLGTSGDQPTHRGFVSGVKSAIGQYHATGGGSYGKGSDMAETTGPGLMAEPYAERSMASSAAPKGSGRPTTPKRPTIGARPSLGPKRPTIKS